MTAYLLLGGRCVLAAVFAVSALAKFRAPREFASALRAMAVVPERLAGVTAAAVPVVEVAAGLLVWAPKPIATWGFVLSGVMFAIFAVVLVSVLRRGLDVSCSCFGASGVPVSRAHVGRNLVLLGIAGAGLVASAGSSPGDLGATGVVVVLLVAVFASILIIATDTLVELFSTAR
ncbi:MauE/DoxX family redox-associated membrane protein [Kitasatospora sp. NPDC059327]|uniref:MauE/DoxX family redox-associated membrane protein n=1 Tax=Kitasatospora sp. NPDC059327 TaxID=3346803 RepID=UPI003692ADD0